MIKHILKYASLTFRKKIIINNFESPCLPLCPRLKSFFLAVEKPHYPEVVPVTLAFLHLFSTVADHCLSHEPYSEGVKRMAAATWPEV